MSYGSSSGGLRDKIESSTVIDIMTVSVLAYDFMLLKDQGFGTTNIFQFSTTPEIIAAQLTGLLLVIYILEAIVDSSKSDH
ncbi:hypothetical protein [Candidatus Nanohalovita haloferacivicina]|uniref:hypothetical protein n=1 Tax=Candidatus Nanohalovita haloferacivicina TaxID=2978046 RepID=UPI00325F995F|nr:hypothetical protein HBNXNv_0743 [Candidatus Nanohalobia archaeon BNXNv]